MGNGEWEMVKNEASSHRKEHLAEASGQHIRFFGNYSVFESLGTFICGERMYQVIGLFAQRHGHLPNFQIAIVICFVVHVVFAFPRSTFLDLN